MLTDRGEGKHGRGIKNGNFQGQTKGQSQEAQRAVLGRHYLGLLFMGKWHELVCLYPYSLRLFGEIRYKEPFRQ